VDGLLLFGNYILALLQIAGRDFKFINSIKTGNYHLYVVDGIAPNPSRDI
jgi:hypothetical protein